MLPQAHTWKRGGLRRAQVTDLVKQLCQPASTRPGNFPHHLSAALLSRTLTRVHPAPPHHFKIYTHADRTNTRAWGLWFAGTEDMQRSAHDNEENRGRRQALRTSSTASSTTSRSRSASASYAFNRSDLAPAVEERAAPRQVRAEMRTYQVATTAGTHVHSTRVAYGVPWYSTRVAMEFRFSPIQVFAKFRFSPFRFSPFPRRCSCHESCVATSSCSLAWQGTEGRHPLCE
jgi:hypothetical protein